MQLHAPSKTPSDTAVPLDQKETSAMTLVYLINTLKMTTKRNYSKTPI